MRGAALLAAASVLLIGASDPQTETEHVVKPDETLGGIANRAGVPRVLIIEANGLKAPYALRANQRLVIPRRRSHTVKEGETGFGIALDYGVPWKTIASASGIDSGAPVKEGQKLVIPTVAISVAASSASPKPGLDISPPSDLSTRPPMKLDWPVKGKIRRDFVARKGRVPFHDGVDILSPEGSVARASAAGKVIFAGQGPKEYGLTVIIHHGGRWTTTYSFLQRVTVKEGEKVKAGERVGLIGETGLATEPQLHFEVRHNRAALDPVRYLPDQ